MSVINTMLKDLDARGASAQPAVKDGGLPRPLAPKRAQPSAWRLPALLLGGGLVLGFAAFADWPKLTGSASPGPAPAPALPIEASAAAPPAVQTPRVVAEAPSPPAKATTESVAPAPKPALPAPQRVALAAPAEPKPIPAPIAQKAPEPALEAATERATATPLVVPVVMPARIDKRPTQLSPEQRALALYAQATELAQAGQRRTALGRALEALALDPRHAPTRLLAAVLEHETGADARAVRLLSEGLVHHPRDGAQALLLARLLVAQGANSDALSVLDQQAVTGADADGLRGGILAQQGDFKRSLSAYENAARQQPGNPMWWFGLGVALESEGMGSRARQAYAKAQALGLPRQDLAAYAENRMRSLD